MFLPFSFSSLGHETLQHVLLCLPFNSNFNESSCHVISKSSFTRLFQKPKFVRKLIPVYVKNKRRKSFTKPSLLRGFASPTLCLLDYQLGCVSECLRIHLQVSFPQASKQHFPDLLRQTMNVVRLPASMFIALINNFG